jgi:hypothetical protein
VTINTLIKDKLSAILAVEVPTDVDALKSEHLQDFTLYLVRAVPK